MPFRINGWWRKLFFGIDDNGNIKGLSDVKQACLDIENKINDSITPQPQLYAGIAESRQNDKTDCKKRDAKALFI